MHITDIITLLNTKHPQYHITLFKGASDELITHFEEKLNLELPGDIKVFYRFCNGFESAEDLFRIIPLGEILDNAYKFQTHHFYIAEYLGYCDVWEVEMNPNDAPDYKIVNRKSGNEKHILSNSFAEFIHRFLAGGIFEKEGLYQWHEEVEKTI